MIRFIFLIIGCASLLSGCVFKSSGRSNVIVIAVEGLGFDTFSCGSAGSETADGFSKFCAESIRFTHAYAPSTMAQTNLASVLTGQTPAEHEVLHNGPLYLSEAIETVAEAAVKKGFRTAFVSGGPPIWRKSGLDQGFEIFEDNILIDVVRLYRSAGQNFDIFFKWIDREISSEPIFAVFFLPDLQFPLSRTVNDNGDERGLGEESQLAEISESLSAFIDEMKEREIWDNSNIFLIGTNGRISSTRQDEIRPLNLHSENVQVVLMGKPARRAREESREWSIDSNVSLVDVGATLRDLIGDKGQRSKQATTLTSALERPAVTWPKDRILVSESSWAEWRGIGETRKAFRQEQFLYLADARPQLYNTLTDRTESTPMSATETMDQARFESLFRSNQKRAPWAPPNDFIVEKIKIGAQLFGTREVQKETILRLAFLAKVRPWESQAIGWLANLYLEQKNWDELEDLGEQAKNPDWIFIARTARGALDNVPPPRNECLNSLLFKKTNSETGCIEKEAQALKTWVETTNDTKPDAEEKFMRLYLRRKVEERIATLNYRNGLMWDTVLDLPAAPTAVDLAFSLPALRRYKGSVDKRISRLASEN